jgi:glycerate kinase
MRVLIAFDKFKDALTARQACETAAGALRAQHPDWILDLCPLTDGGEGFCESLTLAAQGRLELVEAMGPRGLRKPAPVGFIENDKIPAPARAMLAAAPENNRVAVVGLASASGIEFLARDQRDPWQATTFGTGELLARAAAKKSGQILLGLGGSATNDLGLGALAALGFRFHSGDGTAIAVPTPGRWARITRIEPVTLNLPPIFIACDVTNPLLGRTGATATFGPQKGLQPGDAARFEAEMARMASLLCAACGQPFSLADTPGTGAAGGIGFGLMIATGGARLVPGFDLVSAWLDLPARLAAADLVLTGEGRFDATSLTGKGPGSLVREARKLGKAAHIFAGSLGVPPEREFHAITPPNLPLAEALPRTAELLAAAVAKL